MAEKPVQPRTDSSKPVYVTRAGMFKFIAYRVHADWMQIIGTYWTRWGAVRATGGRVKCGTCGAPLEDHPTEAFRAQCPVHGDDWR